MELLRLFSQSEFTLYIGKLKCFKVENESILMKEKIQQTSVETKNNIPGVMSEKLPRIGTGNFASPRLV